MVAHLAQRAILPSLPLVDGSRRAPPEDVEGALWAAAGVLEKGGSCREVEAILLRAGGDCSNAVLLPMCVCLHVAAGRQVAKKTYIFFLFSFLFLSFEFQILSARFRVLNPYQVPISNLTLTLTCSALKVQLLHKLLFIVFCEHAQLLAIIAAKLFSMYTLNVFILLLAHRLKPPPLAFAIWAAATLLTCSQWATCK